jgi:restriction system protein
MARRRESGLDIVRSLPWPVGILSGIVLFFIIRYGLGWYFASATTGVFKQLGPAFTAASAPLAWAALVACWFAAGFSYWDSRRRKTLLESQTGLDSIATMSWQNFERLVGEAFRRRGYAVEETGLGGADGGIDLILRKDGRKELVQCKQWRLRQVNVGVVREMWGLVDHHQANGMKIVCIGDFTRDAKEFANGKPIELLHGEQLDAMIQDVRSARATAPTRVVPTISANESVPIASAPTCPKCGGAMVERINSTTKKPFWGCASFPKCRGTLETSRFAK